MPRKPNWTTRRGGYLAAEFRITVTLEKETWENAVAAAQLLGQDIHESMMWAAKDAIENLLCEMTTEAETRQKRTRNQ